jgi:hypothetical protein
MAVDALTPNGTEYEVYYRASFDLFKHYLPNAEYMIKSFQLTGDGSAATDFSLREEGFSLNDTATSTNITGANSSNDDDFSLIG